LITFALTYESGKICMLATTVKNAKNRFGPVHFCKSIKSFLLFDEN